jgi:membrane fusion protein (multidrug efflux system)
MAEEQEKPKSEEKEAPKKKGSRTVLFLVLGIVVVAAAIGGTYFWGYLSSYELTDDAQVDGHLYSISSRIAGTVSGVFVEDNQVVTAGQTLVTLDPRDNQVALEQAQAELVSAQADVTAQNPNIPITSTTNATTISNAQLDIAAGQANVAAALANVAAAEEAFNSAVAQVRLAQANHVNDEAEVARYKALVDKDEVSREQYEAKVTAAKASQATVEANQALADSRRKQVDQAKSQVEQSKAQLDQFRARALQAFQNAPRQLAIQQATTATRQADVLKNRAAVDQAQLNLQYLKILAPAGGIIGKKNVELGARVSVGQELLALVPLDDIWITANFKETQLKKMREGQRVTVKVDAFGRDYDGYLASVAAASGAKYSLLPPENATGNFVKVVQRIPVRIRLNKGQNDDHRLRPGMSVEPKVWLQ